MSKYYCEKCHYTSYNKINFETHCRSQRHLSETPRNFICPCKKSFISLSGFYKHKKRCSFLIAEKEKRDKAVETLEMVSAQLTELNQTVSTVNQSVSTVNQSVNYLKEKIDGPSQSLALINSNNNNTKNYITLNILNTQFRNVIPLNDFIDKIIFEKDAILDLLNSNERNQRLNDKIANLYSEIIQGCSIKERPLHCIMDNETCIHETYIKNNENWIKEKEITYEDTPVFDESLQKFITNITNEIVKLDNEINKLELENPEKNKKIIEKKRQIINELINLLKKNSRTGERPFDFNEAKNNIFSTILMDETNLNNHLTTI